MPHDINVRMKELQADAVLVEHFGWILLKALVKQRNSCLFTSCQCPNVVTLYKIELYDFNCHPFIFLHTLYKAADIFMTRLILPFSPILSELLDYIRHVSRRD